MGQYESIRRKACALALGLTMGLGIAAAAPTDVRADNPIVQTIYSTDPAPLVVGDEVYVFTGHDEDGASYYDMRDWHCYSTKDMVNWTDHGVPLSLATFSWAKSDAWAGQVIERGGKYYYYVPITAKTGGTAIGVAVADRPEGPYKDAIGRPLCQGFGYIDPTVFIDNDGQAYLYWGNPDLHYVKLNKNMTSYSGKIETVNLTPDGFGPAKKRSSSYEEGPWFYRRGNLYYMIYSAGGIPEHIAYSTSSSPTGPWKYRGVIMPTEGRSFTNHAGVVDFKGKSYFFYHNGALPGGSGFARSVCVEEFKYNPDGSFPTIKMTTNGPSAIAALNPYQKVEAETICQSSGLKVETCSEGTQNISFIDNNDWIKVKNVNFGNGADKFQARVASAASGGTIELHLNSKTGPVIGTCKVNPTGGWQTWTTASCSVNNASGIHDLYLVFKGGSGSIFNLNWWQFSGQNGQVPTSAPRPTATPKPTAAPGVTSTPDSTARISDGWYYVKNVNAQKYLQVAGNKAAAGTNVELRSKNGQAGQRWYLKNRGDGLFTLTSALGDFMLDVSNDSPDDGANVGIYHAYSGHAQQFQAKETGSGTFVITTNSSNLTKALDDYANSRDEGANVCQWTYNGKANQQWLFEAADGGSSSTPAATATPKPTATTAPSQSAKGLTLTTNVNSWSGGGQINFKISNRTGRNVNGWTLKIAKAGMKITSCWTVKIKEEGSFYIITPENWNANLANGQDLEFGAIVEGNIGKIDYSFQ